ncbi:DDE_3 domain-containing protein [Trichonephila clavipes]|uniref:DDE_3 domain-containing protein n=1 Tax=Trichonephila clavipes TaxID=2585209 RepID=A0A8X7BMH6_TRICX|nr:DDE_3 domain-containing protein [Trichonephila clavipes]
MRWAAVSWFFVGPIVNLEGRITREKYREMLAVQVPPMIQTLLPAGDAIFLDDNAPIHAARHIQSCDEAHFWLNGYVNKQNCRIWSEANPQVYVKTPLHPEKLTVWCVLWAGGILQKR